MTNKHKEEAKKIANGIGSPHGEGVFYNGKTEEEASHLIGKGDYKNLVEDIMSLCEQVRKDEREKIVGEIEGMKTKALSYGWELKAKIIEEIISKIKQ